MESAFEAGESIKMVGPADRAKVNAILTAAFSMCPFVRWLYPEPERYLRHFDEFIDYYCGDVYTNRSGAYFDDGEKGAVLWQRDDVHRDDARMMTWLLESIPEYRRREAKKLIERFAKYHPTEPCWYYSALGIDPIHQRRRLGEVLFRYATSECDKAKRVAFGEATTMHAARMYERAGWKIMGEVQVGSSPPLYPVVHYPH